MSASQAKGSLSVSCCWGKGEEFINCLPEGGEEGLSSLCLTVRQRTCSFQSSNSNNSLLLILYGL